MLIGRLGFLIRDESILTVWAMKAGFSLSSDSDSSLEPPESGSDSDSGEDRRDYKPGGYNP
eukprot:COSAG01_NODE_26142_length_722_cov_1.759230_1_plen_60_part_10